MPSPGFLPLHMRHPCFLDIYVNSVSLSILANQFFQSKQTRLVRTINRLYFMTMSSIMLFSGRFLIRCLCSFVLGAKTWSAPDFCLLYTGIDSH